MLYPRTELAEEILQKILQVADAPRPRPLVRLTWWGEALAKGNRSPGYLPGGLKPRPAHIIQEGPINPRLRYWAGVQRLSSEASKKKSPGTHGQRETAPWKGIESGAVS